MAARIQADVKKWIEPDETGFILGRQGSDNISLNLQSIAARDKQPSELLSIDAEKAFDQVEGGTIHKTALFTDDILLFIKKQQPFFHFPHLWNSDMNMDQCLDVKFMKINQKTWFLGPGPYNSMKMFHSVGLKKVSSISALWWHPILVNYNKLIEQI